MEQITIAGEVFNAPLRYEEGHELNANEAAALNQTYHENLRNNFAKKVKDAKEANAFDMATFQADFDKYAQTYQFGTRVGGGGGAVRDPVMAEAMRIAKGQIRVAIKAKGGKVSDYEGTAITEAAKGLIARDEKILEMARAHVAEAQAAAAVDLDTLIGGLTPKTAETSAAA